ncbi:unnamed protein product [Thlaspi arvense]|uniref:Uncharacterized protein n=1 Tax=Thlaspi arvense TaxID=13288 RepID=A0AAU9R8D9_THLAR|nr:unnamed protein product [Thlaspi arvense]
MALRFERTWDPERAYLLVRSSISHLRSSVFNLRFIANQVVYLTSEVVRSSISQLRSSVFNLSFTARQLVRLSISHPLSGRQVADLISEVIGLQSQLHSSPGRRSHIRGRRSSTSASQLVRSSISHLRSSGRRSSTSASQLARSSISHMRSSVFNISSSIIRSAYQLIHYQIGLPAHPLSDRPIRSAYQLFYYQVGLPAHPLSDWPIRSAYQLFYYQVDLSAHSLSDRPISSSVIRSAYQLIHYQVGLSVHSLSDLPISSSVISNNYFTFPSRSHMVANKADITSDRNPSRSHTVANNADLTSDRNPGRPHILLSLKVFTLPSGSRGAIMTITFSVGSSLSFSPETKSDKQMTHSSPSPVRFISGCRGVILTITLSVGVATVSAFRTSQMLLKPLVNAVNMEPMVALREQPELLTGNKI